MKVCSRTAVGFIVMGFIGFFVKLLFIVSFKQRSSAQEWDGGGQQSMTDAQRGESVGCPWSSGVTPRGAGRVSTRVCHAHALRGLLVCTSAAKVHSMADVMPWTESRLAPP